MGRLTEERKSTLLRRYGSGNGKKIFGPGPGRRPGFRPGPGPGPGGPRGFAAGLRGSKPQNILPTVKRLFSYIGRDKIKIPFVFACVLASTFAHLGGSYILRPVINNLFYADISVQEKIHNLIMGLLLMGAIYIGEVICSYAQQRIMIEISQNAIVRIRKDLFSKIQKLPLKFHDTHTHGEIMSRFTNDVDMVAMMMNNTLPQVFSGIVSLIGTLALMFFTNWILSVIILVTTPALFYVGSIIGKRSYKYYVGQQQALGAVNGYTEEMVTGLKVVKVFCHEDTVQEEFEFLSNELYENQRKAQFFGSIMGPVMGNLSQVSYAISATVGGILCLTANFDIGGLMIFTNYSRQFSRPVNMLAQQVNMILAALAGAERVFNVMDEEPEPADLANAIEVCNNGSKREDAHLIKGELVLKNVTFGYTPEKTVLKSINVTAKPGQKVAFVGSTGAGKTTITNLINRFYDIENGQIFLDGIDIKQIKRDSLRRNIAMVLQDTHLFSGTVRENIRYGRLDATDEEVVAAAKIANAHSFIERLSDGYDTMLDGDGTNLSQGQRQLLNIARAAISNAPILILDEATSSVDTRTEKYIQQGLDQLMKGKTTFVIAHRLSTVRNCDLIIVLENGEIIEQGSHEELLEKKGRYYQLYTGAIELD